MTLSNHRDFCTQFRKLMTDTCSTFMLTFTDRKIGIEIKKIVIRLLNGKSCTVSKGFISLMKTRALVYFKSKKKKKKLYLRIILMK